MLSLSKSKMLKETKPKVEICSRNRINHLLVRVCEYGSCLGCTCGGGNRAPSPSPADKAMLSPVARGVWTGYCRYGNEAGDFKQEVLSVLTGVVTVTELGSNSHQVWPVALVHTGEWDRRGRRCGCGRHG